MTYAFAVRNAKEMLRDRLNFAFGLGFPLVLLLLLSMIQANVPVELFAIRQFAPGVAVFGLSFIALFSGMLIAKDRSTSFMLRLCASPLSAGEVLLGYAIPMLPLALGQILVCFAAAACLGLPVNGNVLLAALTLLPAACLFIALGLLCGCLFNDKQVGGVCGALLTNVSAWLSGTWFDVELVGGIFAKIADALPFLHAVKAGRAAIAGDYAGILPELWWVIGYAVVLMGIAIAVFIKKRRADAV